MDIRYSSIIFLLIMPVLLIGACSDQNDNSSTIPASVPELGQAQLGSGAGPTPVPVTPTPTPTPSAAHITLYDPVWEGSQTIKPLGSKEEITRDIVLEFMPRKMIGEGSSRRRDEGAIFIEGNDAWMSLSFVKVDNNTGALSFRVTVIGTRFDGVIEGNKIRGTSMEGSVNKGTFEVKANPNKSPQRRPDAEHGM